MVCIEMQHGAMITLSNDFILHTRARLHYACGLGNYIIIVLYLNPKVIGLSFVKLKFFCICVPYMHLDDVRIVKTGLLKLGLLGAVNRGHCRYIFSIF